MPLPSATYRLQFRNEMDFNGAMRLIPHLVRLGISHLYASPIFTAVSGSQHGYDVTDFNEIDPALGGEKQFRRLVRALKAHRLGLILDIVPNHMAANLENSWWHSVVEWGRASAFAGFFDIDWQEPLTLPFLEASFEEELAAGNLRFAFDTKRHCLAMQHFGALYPLDPASYPLVLKDAPLELQGLAAIAAAARPETAERFHSALAAAVETPPVAAALEAFVGASANDRQTLRLVHRMQPWRLTSWKTAQDHLSYRRFFEITGLVGVRVEDPVVFECSHRLVLDLVEEGMVDGLRVDHVDGLADPERYLHRLRQRAGERTYIIVEKILEETEALPQDWPVEGTTGYEFISALAELLADESPSGLWSEARRAETREAVLGCKLQVLRHNFNTEVMRLARLAAGLGSPDDPPRDMGRLAKAIRRLLAAMPVYRTYIGESGATGRDSHVLDEIESIAAAAAPTATAEITFVASVLRSDHDQADRRRQLEFRTRFQQLSGAVMAKAVEDTLFYRSGDYLAANEVGAAPARKPGGVRAFHAMMADRARRMPHGLSATATHDTKRGEDARARLHVLSEAYDVWTGAVARWHETNAGRIRQLSDGEAPEAPVEQLLYQSLLGTWPVEPLREGEEICFLRERIDGFAVKMLREAKLRTSWDHPNEPYETAVRTFLRELLDFRNPAFLDDFGKTARPFIRAGLINSLAQTLVKLTAPGVPDIYQGSEGLDLCLVDPDNRRSVSPRRSPPELPKAPVIDDFEDCKQHLIEMCLQYRQGRGSQVLARGEYRPMTIEGPGARHAAAFMRRTGEALAVTVVPRLVFGHTDGERLAVLPRLWQNTFLIWPADGGFRELRNLATGAPVETRPQIAIAELLADFPVALLVED
ncbi:MAG TPA: malto-oligosyltrehalose synthase [Mycoplana sp.]|nr:malto-oligosyltrehalose synthase [Mycoplana sp.]